MSGSVMTVLGPVEPDQIGQTLMHEHVFIDITPVFLPPDEATLKPLVNAPVSMQLLGPLRRRPFSLCLDNMVLADEEAAVGELGSFFLEGGSTLVDCTVIGIGRDPAAVRRVARASRLNIVQGTGIYVERAHPEWVSEASVEKLADLFIRDIRDGIGDTGIRAGIIGEIGTSGIEKGKRTKSGDMTRSEEKVLRASGRASAETGVAVSVHLDPRGQGAFAVIDALAAEGVQPGRMVMCHMDANPDLDYHLAVADRGVFIEYDHFGREYYAVHMDRYPTDARRIELLCAMLEAGHDQQLLLSQDICCKIDLRKYGGVGYGHLLRELLPLFRRAGITEHQIRQMLVENPRRVLTS